MSQIGYVKKIGPHESNKVLLVSHVDYMSRMCPKWCVFKTIADSNPYKTITAKLIKAIDKFLLDSYLDAKFSQVQTINNIQERNEMAWHTRNWIKHDATVESNQLSCIILWLLKLVSQGCSACAMFHHF